MINFSKENQLELEGLYVKLSFQGEVLTGTLGANAQSPYSLLTGTSISSLTQMRNTLKREIATFDAATDEWTVSNYQKAHNNKKREWEKFLYLLIGYKRFKEEEESVKTEVKELETVLAVLEDQAKTPAERIAETKAKLEAKKSVIQ